MAKNIKTYQEIIEKDANIKWSDPHLWQIFQFYVVECPSRNGSLKYPISAKGKLLASYGWTGGNNCSALKKAFIHTCSTPEAFENIVKNSSIISKLGELTPPTEYCIFSYSKNEMETLLRKIRNAFAHGHFYQTVFKKQKIYVLQSFYHGKLNAEMALYEQTLLEWINIIKRGPFKK